MSLDVSLITPAKEVICTCEHCKNEHTATVEEEVYSDNITHNLGLMAGKADLYEPLWHTGSMGISTAGELIPYLEAGLAKLKGDPVYYERFNDPKGWGLYEHLVVFVDNYLAACTEYPTARIEVSI